MNMKRLIYFILFMVSFMFVSCNHDIDYDYGKYETDKYNAAFIKTFGQPASNQTWGFGSSTTTRAAQPNANQIKLEVYKNGEWIEMTANKGVAAAKIAVRQNFEYCRERVGISSKYPDFGNWVQDVDYIWW